MKDVEALLDALHKKGAVGPSIVVYFHASPLDVVVGYANCRSLGAILEALGGALCTILQVNFGEYPFHALR